MLEPALRLAWATLALALLLCSCAPAGAVKGVIDLTHRDWSQGAVSLMGEWGFDAGFRPVPDTWKGSVAGGRDGRGSGTYRLRVLVNEKAPPLALRFGSIATAAAIRVNGVELLRIGNPDVDPAKARSAYAPGILKLPPGPMLDVEFFVSNHDYRVGGLWTTPSIGPADTVEHSQWAAEVGAVGLAAALMVVGLSALLLFLFRSAEKTFLHLGLFALLVALRSLVTGEYVVVKLFPGIPFEILVRLEYLTAYFLLGSGATFFSLVFPGLFGRWALRAFLWPSFLFGSFVFLFPLAWLTRSIPWFYPIAIPALVYGLVMLVRRILKTHEGFLFLAGVTILSVSGMFDMLVAALYSNTGIWVPWGMGIFVLLQAASLAQRFLTAFAATERLLGEKEFLIREIHHRVKNSLQVVASLVTLQANRLEEPSQKAMLQALRRRITAIAMVHEKLYGQGLERRPELGEYLRDLLNLQYTGDALDTGKVVLEVGFESLTAGVDYCIDAGLIVTELVGNAHKHAVLARGEGHVSVKVEIQDQRLVISVEDDGPGFPRDFKPETPKGMGFRLVLALLQRNDGALSFPQGPGGRVRVELKLPSASD